MSEDFSTCVLASGACVVGRNNWWEISVGAEPLHAVKIEGTTIGFQCCSRAGDVDFFLKAALCLSRVTRRTWKMPVPGLLKPHKHKFLGVCLCMLSCELMEVYYKQLSCKSKTSLIADPERTGS